MPEASPKAATPRSQRKVRKGVVVSNGMDQSIVVRIERTVMHPL